MSKSIYKVEDRGSRFFCDGTIELPDFRVVLYVDGEWVNEWDGLWTEQQAIEKAINSCFIVSTDI